MSRFAWACFGCGHWRTGEPTDSSCKHCEWADAHPEKALHFECSDSCPPGCEGEPDTAECPVCITNAAKVQP